MKSGQTSKLVFYKDTLWVRFAQDPKERLS